MLLALCIVGSRVEQTPHVDKTSSPVWNKVYEVIASRFHSLSFIVFFLAWHRYFYDSTGLFRVAAYKLDRYGSSLQYKILQNVQ